MKILFYILLIFGVCEIVANLLFFVNILRGQDYKQAKKFHGDFPPYESNGAWVGKILAMLCMGVVALITAFFIYKGYNQKVVLLFSFAGGMVAIGILQLLAYGRKHLPAIGSFIIGLIFLALAFFLH